MTLRAALAGLLVWLAAVPAAAQERPFDAFVLALSWSPSWCQDPEQAERAPLQCSPRRPFGWIVHGLWPQADGQPVRCPQSRERVPEALVSQMLPWMPSAGLIGQQWRSHGSCTGLTQERYFFAIRAARARIIAPDPQSLWPAGRVAPADLERAFVQANPGLDARAIAVTCREGALAEVRVCFDRRLRFAACPGVDERACRSAQVQVPGRRRG